MNENLAIRSEIRRNEKRNADTEIDVGALRQVASHTIGNAVARQRHVAASSYRGSKSRGWRSISTIWSIFESPRCRPNCCEEERKGEPVSCGNAAKQFGSGLLDVCPIQAGDVYRHLVLRGLSKSYGSSYAATSKNAVWTLELRVTDAAKGVCVRCA